MRWVAGYLGHPVRPLDFGARRVLQVALRLDSVAAQRVLAETVNAGGWAAEAALLAVLTAPPGDRPTSLSRISPLPSGRQRPVPTRSVAASPAASRIATASRRRSHRAQAARGYHLALPPLPRRSAAELDSHGTPHLDVHDPQHLVAPFDLPLTWAAERAGLEQPPF